MAPLVLSLCDFTGNAVRPWAEHGYECWTVDIKHPAGIGELEANVRKVGADVRKFCPPLNREVAFVFAFPPCTHLARSGARWFRAKGLDAVADAMSIVAACDRICKASGAPYLIENPVGMLSTYWREPDHTFNPYEYASHLENPVVEAYTKKTCLWTGGGFVMPEKTVVVPVLGSKIYKAPDSKGRADRRSVTPIGFSLAVFLANAQDARNAS